MPIMKIFIKVLRGEGCELDVEENSTVLDLKKQIQEGLKVPIAQQTLLLVGKALIDNKPINFYPAIKEGTKLHLIVKKTDSLATVLSRFFAKYYTEEQSQLILSEFLRDFHAKVESLSLDDLERIATSYLKEES